jgi:hypothetical protein
MKSDSLGGPQRDIHWKLTFGLSLLIILLCSMIGFSGLLIERMFWFSFTILSSCSLIIPALIIGRRVHFDRFLHGFITGLIGWTLGVLIMVLLLVVAQPYLDPKAPSDWGQGVGIGAMMLWLFGVINSPMIGLLASWMGRDG